MPLTDQAIRAAKPNLKPVGKDENGKAVFERTDGPYKMFDGKGLYPPFVNGLKKASQSTFISIRTL